MSKVVIGTGKQALDVIFEELRVERALEGKETIFIKPNLRAAAVAGSSRCSITNTDVIRELTKKLVAMGKKVIIGEATSSRYITEKALDNCGIKSLGSDAVKIMNLNTVPSRKVNIKGEFLKKMYFPAIVLDAEYTISLPVMKTHCLTGVTLGLKNMMGATSDIGPAIIHTSGLDGAIAELNTVIGPDLSIIDATRAMEGSGPVRGNEVELDTILGGYDPVAVDATAARIMGFEPGKVEHLATAERMGIGKLEPDEIVGDFRVREFIKPGEDDVQFLNLYTSRSFNWLMKNRFFHKIAYDYFYFFWKKIRN